MADKDIDVKYDLEIELNRGWREAISLIYKNNKIDNDDDNEHDHYRKSHIFSLYYYSKSSRKADVLVTPDKIIISSCRRVYPIVIELKDTLKKLLDTYEFKYTWVEKDTNGLLVQDIFNELGVRNYSITYGDTRTLEKCHFREAEAFIISLFGGLVVFKKRGGYLAYKIVMNDHHYASCNVVSLQQAIDLINKANELGYGKTYVSEDFKTYIKTKVMLDVTEKEIFEGFKDEIMESVYDG